MQNKELATDIHLHIWLPHFVPRCKFGQGAQACLCGQCKLRCIYQEDNQITVERNRTKKQQSVLQGHTEIENTPVILDVTNDFLIVLEPGVPNQWPISKNPEHHPDQPSSSIKKLPPTSYNVNSFSIYTTN